eukprot:11745289-Karenia_brevis.AAC.2
MPARLAGLGWMSMKSTSGTKVVFVSSAYAASFTNRAMRSPWFARKDFPARMRVGCQRKRRPCVPLAKRCFTSMLDTIMQRIR